MTPEPITGLTSVPDEILFPIFYASRNPDLTRVCRELRRRLPRGIDIIRDLTVLAYAPRRPSVWHWSTIPPIQYPTGIDIIVKESGLIQEELQFEVSASQWLTPAILRVAHAQIYKHFVRAACLFPGTPLSPSRQAVIEQLLWNADRCYHKDRLESKSEWYNDNFDTSTGAGWHVYDSSVVRQTDQQSFYYLSTFKAIFVPRCLLDDPIDATSVSLLRTFSDRGTGDGEEWRPLECSSSQLEQKILKALCDPIEPERGPGLWRILCHLNDKTAEPCAITREMMDAAISVKKPERLKHLIEHYTSQDWDFLAKCKLGLIDLLRLELSLLPRKEECLRALSSKNADQHSGTISKVAKALTGLERARNTIKDSLELFRNDEPYRALCGCYQILTEAIAGPVWFIESGSESITTASYQQRNVDISEQVAVDLGYAGLWELDCARATVKMAFVLSEQESGAELHQTSLDAWFRPS